MKTTGESLGAVKRTRQFKNTKLTVFKAIHEKHAYARTPCAHARTDDSATHLQNSSIDLHRLTRVLETYLSELYPTLPHCVVCTARMCYLLNKLFFFFLRVENTC